MIQSSTETVLWAGSIVRYHSRPTAQRQTVAEHTWRVLIIYTELYGMPRAEVYQNIIYHDVPEIITGDIPFMAKRLYPQLKQVLHHIELDEVPKKLGLNLPQLTPGEKYQIKVADNLEMLFWAVDDVNMGCLYSIDIINNILEVLGDDENARSYIRAKGYQGPIDSIRFNGTSFDASAAYKRRIQNARPLHRETDGGSTGADKLGESELQPERNDIHDYAQSG